ncbi:MFS transporter [Actinocrispum wychmicini]|uniref:Putative MFS family arabinose efflux permease n=1 Tax=Actinocrispum wychmicini TaxID=1213861 RepID=A0A4R2IUA3_9PSEU|nr:MFS transporter [Actinocrispum wychmicini]TCO47976.1 putative MFS family arabinose efflux permease [Actinocrispum wychmicini]
MGDERLPREVWILLAAVFLVAMGYGVISPVLPALAASFNVGVTAASFVISAYSVVRLVFAPFGGRLVARFSERPVYLAGLTIAAVATAACAWAGSYWQLLAFRSFGGIGSVMFTVAGLTLVLRLTPVGLRGRVSSLWATSFLLGNICGPALGGLVAGVSTRLPFIGYGVATLAAAFLSWLLLRRSTRVAPGATLEIPEMPVRQALRSRAYLAVLGASFVYGWMVIGVRFALVPLFVVVELKRDDVVAGTSLTLFAVGTGSVVLLAGRLVDRRGRKPLALAGLVVIAIGALALGFAPSTPLFMVASLIGGIGSGLLNPALTATVADVVGVDRRGGTVLAFFQMAGDLGGIAGPLVAGAIADNWSYQAAFTATGVVAVLSAGFWLTAPETLVGGREPPTRPPTQAEPGSDVCGPAADTSSS